MQPAWRGALRWVGGEVKRSACGLLAGEQPPRGDGAGARGASSITSARPRGPRWWRAPGNCPLWRRRQVRPGQTTTSESFQSYWQTHFYLYTVAVSLTALALAHTWHVKHSIISETTNWACRAPLRWLDNACTTRVLPVCQRKAGCSYRHPVILESDIADAPQSGQALS